MKSPESGVISIIYPFGFVSEVTPRWLAVLFTLVVCLAGISWTEVAAIEPDQKTTNQAASTVGSNAVTQLDALSAKAQAKGQVPVILRLNVNFQVERRLPAPAVIAQQNAISNTQNTVVQSLAGMNASNIKKYRFVPYLAVTVNAAALQALAKNPKVTEISEDVALPPTLGESTGVVGADTAWGSDYDGNGWAVAVLDTGVDKTHNFLSGKVVTEACYSTTVSGQSTSLCPDGAASSTAANSGLNCPLTTSGCNHGTHVAGIVAGKDYTLNGPGYNGVAKGANIIAIKVFSQFTGTTCTSSGETSPCVRAYISDLIHGLERVFALRTTFNIAAVNMSLGGGQYTSNCDTDPGKSIIDNLRAEGIATVIASGNSYYTNAMGAPACISSAISVGATCDSATAGFGCTAVDDVPSYSNIASFISLLAPGSLISSSTPGADTFASLHGTSMAAPHVAGAWALMKQRDPSASVSTILAAFQTTGTPVDDQRSSGSVTGMRRINVDLALLPQLPAPTFIYPVGGETLTAGVTSNINWTSNESSPTFNDTMESGASNWDTAHGAGTLEWSLGTSNPHGGSYAWFASDPSTISDQYLTTIGALDVPVDGKLSFWHRYNTGSTFDGGVVEISTDGLVWIDLGPFMTQGGYNGTVSTCCGNPIGGRAAFTGDSGGYRETVVDLSSYAGQLVHIRFRMATDSSASAGGWYVDDVKLFGSSASYELAYTDNCTPNIYVADDMEHGTALWSISHGAGALDWALGTSNPHGGSYAWFASDPSAISDQYLASIGSVQVPANGKLSFWHSYNTESTYDGGVVEISTNGQSWTDLDPLITQGGYNSTISTCCGNPIGGRPAFSGNSGGYVETIVDLSSYAGQSVFIRFRMATDSSVSAVGWYVDDATLTGGDTTWTVIGTTAPGAGSLPWSVPATAGNDYCLNIQATSPGYLDSPLVTSAPFTVSADSDGDGLSDELENNVLGTDPFSVDSDTDGLVDGSGGLVPLAVLPAGVDVNSDGFVDGEQDFGTSPIINDSDDDGVSDGDEVGLYGIDPTVSNIGDVGPRGSPDNAVNLSDLVVLTRLVTGAIQPTALESILGDINGDGQLNAADLLLLERSIVFGSVP